MAYIPRILAFAGSLRQESWNQKLIKIAVKSAKDAGAAVTMIDLKDFPLPIFDEDLEKAGIPENVNKLKELFLAHDGLILASPEYNSSITAVLKNTIDWVSRRATSEFNYKTAVIMSASPGALGGLRGLVHVRSILSNMNVLVLPQQVAVSKAHEAFNSEGGLKDSKQHSAIEQLGVALTETLKKLHS